MAEPLGLSSSSAAPTCQHRLGFVSRKDLGGGSQGLVSRLVIGVGRPDVPTGWDVGRMKEFVNGRVSLLVIFVGGPSVPTWG